MQSVTAPNNPNWKRGQAIADIPEVYSGCIAALEVIVEGTNQHLFYRVRPATEEEVAHPNVGLLRFLQEEQYGPGSSTSIERWLQAV